MKWMLGGVALAGLAVVASAHGAVRRPEDWRAEPPGRLWTWEELTVSAAAVRLGLDNTPGPEARVNLRRLCAEVLDPLRARWPGVRVNSAFRSEAVNRAVGGVAGSRHLVGLAVDLSVDQAIRAAVTSWLRKRGSAVLQYESHLHVGFAMDAGAAVR